MSVKATSYIEAAKKKPGLLIHLALFATMCILNEGVWDSISEVLPESAKLGHRMIVGETITVLVIIVMAVRGSRNVVRRALQLLVAVTVVTVFNFGIHWFYSRDMAMANKYVAFQNNQKVVESGLANQQAERVEGVLGKLTEFNKSQAQLSRADQEYYSRTGQRRNRRVQSAPDLSQLGIITTPSPTPTPPPPPQTSQVGMVNGLVMPGTVSAASVQTVEVKPLRPEELPIKWGQWFLIGGLLALAVTFVGAVSVAAKWEWDWNANGIADNFEGKA